MTTTAQKAARAAKKTAKTKTTDALIALVIDRSGSMGRLEEATKEGINALLEEQRKIEGKTYISMTLFSTTFDVRHVGVDVNEVPNLGTPGNPYVASGGTALYDAVAAVIKGTEQWLLNHREFTGRVMCVINTDGEENSSASTSLADVNALIEAKQQQDWDFVFMGAGQSAWTEGSNFSSIPASNFVNYAADSHSTSASYAGVTRSLSSSRVSGRKFTGNN